MTQTDPSVQEHHTSPSQLKKKKQGQMTSEKIDFVNLKSSMDLAGFLIFNHRPNSMSLIMR